jgi:hypothetical protein
LGTIEPRPDEKCTPEQAQKIQETRQYYERPGNKIDNKELFWQKDVINHRLASFKSQVKFVGGTAKDRKKMEQHKDKYSACFLIGICKSDNYELPSSKEEFFGED